MPQTKRKLAILLLLSCATWLHAQQASVHVDVHVDASQKLGPLPHIWTYFGYDEPNYTYAPHGRELIRELAALSPVPVYLRTHNLLTTGDGTPALKWGSTNAYTEDASGHPVYDWKIVDKILDTYHDAGAKPFIEIGFMPEALSTHPEPYQHTWPKGDIFTGWAYPPKDYKKWAELVRQLTLHCVSRYGKREAGSWYWEVWNEPNIGYWQGTPAEYDELYDYAVDAVRKVLPKARVGGPATTGPGSEKAAEFLRQFLEHCANGKNPATGKTGAPLDFISFHAKGSPKVVEGHVQMGLANNLNDMDKGFAIVSSFPQFAGLPIVLSESDPEGCAACSARVYPQNAYRNGAMYPAYTATSIRGALDLAASHHSNLQGFLTWAFEFEDQPYFDGFRTLATNGIDKPILNLFRMLGKMSGERVEAESTGAVGVEQILNSGVRGRADVDAIAARSSHGATVLVWNYSDEELPAADADVKLSIAGVAHKPSIQQYRIDHDHSNAYTAWKDMGSPQEPTPDQYARLKAAGQLQAPDKLDAATKDGSLEVNFKLPREGLSLLVISW